MIAEAANDVIDPQLPFTPLLIVQLRRLRHVRVKSHAPSQPATLPLLYLRRIKEVSRNQDLSQDLANHSWIDQREKYRVALSALFYVRNVAVDLQPWLIV